MLPCVTAKPNRAWQHSARPSVPPAKKRAIGGPARMVLFAPGAANWLISGSGLEKSTGFRNHCAPIIFKTTKSFLPGSTWIIRSRVRTTATHSKHGAPTPSSAAVRPQPRCRKSSDAPRAVEGAVGEAALRYEHSVATVAAALDRFRASTGCRFGARTSRPQRVQDRTMHWTNLGRPAMRSRCAQDGRAGVWTFWA